MSTYHSYTKAGVNTAEQDAAMKMILPLFAETFKNRKNKTGENLVPIGHYAAIIHATNDLAIALKTDGVGTKTIVAQQMNKYDTIGIDCVAMNVNDVICTGAEPTSFLDYIAAQKAKPEIMYEIAKGLKEGANRAHVNVVGGETAILPEMIQGVQSDSGIDLVGMCVGTINPKEIIDGKRVSKGDALIGISSSGIHSNGLTLARKKLLGKNNDVMTYNEKLGRTLGEELLEPTFIYVDEIMELKRAGIDLKLAAHITSDGFFNLLRLSENISYKITHLPQPQPIYNLIQEDGNVPITEMYSVFNMGVGMCVVVPEVECDSAIQTLEKFGKKVFVMGEAVTDSNKTITVDTESLKMHGSFNDKKFHQIK